MWRVMDSSAGQLFMIAGLGMVIFRPADVPILARGAGRLVGSAVRALTRMRSAVSASQSTELTSAREQLMRAVRAVDSVTGRVRREITPLGLTTRNLVNADHRLNTADSRPEVHHSRSSDDVTFVSHRVNPRESRHSDTGNRSNDSKLSDRKWTSSQRDSQIQSGADIIASVIEDAAFEDQKRRMYREHGRP